MKHRLLIAFCLLSISLQAQSWFEVANFSGSSRDDGCSFVIDGKAYCGTGRDAGFAYTADFYSFDFSSEMWTAISSLPDSAKRQYATTVTHAGVAYLFGGFGISGYRNDLWKYDPILDSWSFQGTAPFEGRGGHQSFVLEDTLYVVGGRTSSKVAISEVWAYRFDTQAWEQKSSIPGDGIWRGFGVENDSIGIVGFGSDSLDVKHGEIYSYNPTNDSWTEITSLQSQGITYPSAQRTSNRLFVFGGEDALGDYSSSFRYIDLTDNTWHDLNDFQDVPRRGVMSFVSANDFYITTGISATQRLNETWVSRNVVGLELIDFSKFEFLPYQSGDYLLLSKESNRCRIFKISGEVLELKKVEPGKFILPVQLSSGIYILEETDETQTKMCRIPIFMHQ